MLNLLAKPDSFAGVYVWVMFGNTLGGTALFT